MPKILHFILIIICSLSCTKNVNLKGFSPSDRVQLIDKINNIKSKQDAVELLGSPSHKSLFENENWYYVSLTEEYYAFFKPKIKDFQIIELVFNDKDSLKNVKYYDLEDFSKIDANKDFIITEGYKKSKLKSMFNNMGRFNKNQKKSK